MKTIFTYKPYAYKTYEKSEIPAKSGVAMTYKSPCGGIYTKAEPATKFTSKPKKYMYTFVAANETSFAAAGVVAESAANARDYIDDSETILDLPDDLASALVDAMPDAALLPFESVSDGIRSFFWAIVG